MEELGRDTFDASPYGDADVILIDESHNFRNDKANRYLALDTMIQLNGGRGRDGEHKKVILLSATPINNDLYDLANQVRLFTQSRPDYFREAGIGDFNAYFRRARRMVAQGRRAGRRGPLQPARRGHGPQHPALHPGGLSRTPRSRASRSPFPNRRLHTVEYDLGATYGGLYDEIVAAIDSLSLAPYKLEAYKKKSAIADEEQHKFEEGREEGLVGIFKTRFLKRLESSIEAFRLSLRRALDLRGNVQGLPAGQEGRLVEGFSEGDPVPGTRRRRRHRRREPGRRTGRRGRGEGVHREPADRRSQPVRPAEADA